MCVINSKARKTNLFNTTCERSQGLGFRDFISRVIMVAPRQSSLPFNISKSTLINFRLNTFFDMSLILPDISTVISLQPVGILNHVLFQLNCVSLSLKVMFYGKIRNDGFKRNTALRHCCDIASNGCNIALTLQRCVALKIVVTNRLV